MRSNKEKAVGTGEGRWRESGLVQQKKRKKQRRGGEISKDNELKRNKERWKTGRK